MFDFHIHSDFSADCETPMEETIEVAIQKGLTEICFTEHIDEDYPDPTIDFSLDLPNYDAKINEMQCLYQDQIVIRKGLEIGVQPHLLTSCQQIVKAAYFDFVICSMHTTNKQSLHTSDFFQQQTVEDAYRKYYEELLYCVTHFKDFQVLGHIDLVKRYTKNKQAKYDFHDLLTKIFQEIIPAGKGIEINTSGLRYGLPNAMPSNDILTLYKACGGEIITIGSDSHVATTVGYGVTGAIERLRQIGFNYVTTFTDKRAIFHRI
ncbi:MULTISPECIES: histidinol-phosphatase HisJ family protein [Clostridia]|uniref:histidinol-phosphatase HisJ family protein n=1 Tax=Clostridia TaxID=186801 RepID=UPI000EA2AA49|nr:MULTISPECIES: histidinol-phosphatase HisJ family protein [Clostridia]NBJ70017.1 histidinol-phosphatase HisJ family protein [Roseburia sp. 1XD42-34]RKI77382.1 histidinol-phosphatase HisJ family protein [Clostridium sp. 1xD42-85]